MPASFDPSAAAAADGIFGLPSSPEAARVVLVPNRALARRHLEQLVHAVLVAGERHPAGTPSRGGAWERAVNELSPLAEKTYRTLVHETEALPRYLRAATPLDEIERLNIGSRPARRGPATDLADLRAIPSVFAWTQSRVTLPGW